MKSVDSIIRNYVSFDFIGNIKVPRKLNGLGILSLSKEGKMPSRFINIVAESVNCFAV